MFYSVNRPEVERIIIPSQWIDLGLGIHGSIAKGLKYMVMVLQGADGESFIGGSWIRGGRKQRLIFQTPGVAAELAYKPFEGLSMAVNGVLMQSGNGRAIERDGVRQTVDANTGLVSAHARFEHGPFSLMALGTVGWMADTDLIADLIDPSGMNDVILGERVYGYYLELGFDVYSALAGTDENPSRTLLWRTDEMKVPIFVRYERLDTHDAVSARFTGRDDIQRSDLDIVTFGLNFRPRRSVVLKANYQLRNNRADRPFGPAEADRVELGLGFIF